MKTSTVERAARPAGATITAGLARQNREREKALKRLAKLRQRAAAEIERLLAFMDASDPYAATELEDDNDLDDAAYVEGGPRMGSGSGRGHEDDEPDTDHEPSLGSSGHGEAGAISYLVHAISDGEQMIYDCEGDEHDGREPNLGWTTGGAIGGTSDCEITSPEEVLL